MRYRKKPVVIEAIQFQQVDKIDKQFVAIWNGSTMERGVFPDWLRKSEMVMPDDCAEPPEGYWYATDEGLMIGTLEGYHFASPGDFIIQGIAGEIYPCKPDIFERTYEGA